MFISSTLLYYSHINQLQGTRQMKKEILMTKTYNPLTDKQELRDLAPEGFVYGGFDDGYFFYVKELNKRTGQGFICMDVLPEDLTKKNLAMMAKYGITRAKTKHSIGR